MVTVGAVKSSVMACDAEAVHPLPSVTVTVIVALHVPTVLAVVVNAPGQLSVAVVAAIVRRPTGGLYQLGTGTETSINTLMGLLREVMAGDGVEIVHEPDRPGEIRRAFSDISSARADLGYSPDTPLVDGLKITAGWFRQEYAR